MKGKELLETMLNHPDFDPETRIQNLTVETDEEDVTYQVQQGVDFIEIYNEEGELVFHDVPSGMI